MNTPLLQTHDLIKAFSHKTGFFAKPTSQLAVNSISFDLAQRNVSAWSASLEAASRPLVGSFSA